MCILFRNKNESIEEFEYRLSLQEVIFGGFCVVVFVIVIIASAIMLGTMFQ